MKKILTYILAIIAILTISAMIVPKFINQKNLKNSIIELVNTQTGKKLSIEGEVYFSVFPTPRITLKDVKLDGNNQTEDALINADKTILHLSLTKILQRNLCVKEIQMINGKIHSNIDLNNKTSNFSFVKNLKNTNSLEIENLTLKNIDILFNTGAQEYKFLQTNLDFRNGQDKITIDGTFLANGLKTNFDIKFLPKKQGENNFALKVKNENLNIDFAALADFSNNDLTNLTGNLNTEISDINNLNEIMENIIPKFKFDTNNIIAEPIKITSSVSYDLSNLLFSKLLIDNDSLKGNGNILISFGNVSEFDIAFDEINYDTLFTHKDNNLKKSLENYSLQLDKIKQTDFDTKINIKKLRYLKKDIDNINLDFEITDNQLYINELKASFPDDLEILLEKTKQTKVENIDVLWGKLKINAPNLKENIKWLGLEDYINLESDISELNYESQLISSPQEITLFDINAEFDTAVITGNYTFNFIDNNQDKKYEGQLNFINWNFDEVSCPMLISNINNIISKSNTASYLADFKWIREIPHSSKIKLTITDSQYKNHKINNMSTDISIKPGRIILENLTSDSDFALLDNGGMLIDARSLRPVLDLAIAGKFLDLNFLSGIFKNDQNAAANKQNETKWSKESLQYFRFDVFEGSILANLENLKFADLFFPSFEFDGSMRKQNLFINTLKGSLFGGIFDIKGSYSHTDDQPHLSIGFAVQNLSAKNTAEYIFDLHDIIDGNINLRGSFVTHGKSSLDLINNLILDTSISGENLVISDINMKEVIDIASKLKTVPSDEIDSSIKKAISSGTSIINNFSGTFKAQNGTAKTNDITFESYYSNGGFAASIDLVNWLFNSSTSWAFVPQINAKPIVMTFVYSGNFEKNYRSENLQELNSYLDNIFKNKKDHNNADSDKEDNAKYPLYKKLTQ